MKLIKVGLGNPDPIVGDFDGNLRQLLELAKQMSFEQCTLGCFPEQAISGYPAEDLVLWQKFLDTQWEKLEEFAQLTASIPTAFVLGVAVQHDSTAYNCAAVVCQGKILGIVPKEKLPTYNVFYEKRTYSAGLPGRRTTVNGVPFGDIIFDFPFGKLAVEVCEDIWSPDGPMRRRAYSGAEIIVNISASPFRSGVVNTRREMISTRAADNCATLIYVNQFGGNDGLAFDGGGYVNQCGRMLFEAARWLEGCSTTTVDLDRTSRQRRENTTWHTDREDFLRKEKPVPAIPVTLDTPFNLESYEYPVPASGSFFLPEATIQGLILHPRGPREEYLHELVNATITGLDGYFRKTKRFNRIGIALSGGKDSALTLLLARRYAVGELEKKPEELKDFIQCFSMPSEFNSEETKSIARELCEELGVGFTEIPIGEDFAREQETLLKMLPPETILSPLCLQNIQARIRGKRMWDWSNAARGMWLQTGNMSEKAVGYTTIGGDMMGAYSLLGNMPKTVIIALIEHLANSPVLNRLVNSTASAELAKNQADENDLMPFEILDTCFALFVGEKMVADEVVRVLTQMFHRTYEGVQIEDWVQKFVGLFFASIFKWVQAPKSVHLGSLDLDSERALQLPVVQDGNWARRS